MGLPPPNSFRRAGLSHGLWNCFDAARSNRLLFRTQKILAKMKRAEDTFCLCKYGLTMTSVFEIKVSVIIALLFAIFSAEPCFPNETSSGTARPLDTVRLQLKWKHQFQFAGYYAALEKGFTGKPDWM